jgi:hypothetical protein
MKFFALLSLTVFAVILAMVIVPNLDTRTTLSVGGEQLSNVRLAFLIAGASLASAFYVLAYAVISDARLRFQNRRLRKKIDLLEREQTAKQPDLGIVYAQPDTTADTEAVLDLPYESTAPTEDS